MVTKEEVAAKEKTSMERALSAARVWESVLESSERIERERALARYWSSTRSGVLAS